MVSGCAANSSAVTDCSAGEVAFDDVAQAVGEAGGIDIAGDELLFTFALVWLDLERLDEVGVDDAADQSGDHPETEGEQGQAVAVLGEERVRHGGEAGEEGEGDQDVEHRQARVDISVGRAEDDAAGREDEVEDPEVGAERDEQQDDAEQHRQVEPHASGDVEFEALEREREGVDGAGAECGDDHDAEEPALDELVGGQIEHVEGDVAIEGGIFATELDAVEPGEDGLPRPARD